MSNSKKFRMPSAFTIIFMLIVLFIVFSWVLAFMGVKTTNLAGEVVAIKGMGILDSLTAIWMGFQSKSDVILFVLCIGGLLAVMDRTKAIDAGIGSMVRKLKGKEIMLVPALMIIFALGGTTYGMAEETFAFFPLLIPVFIKAGLGGFTAVLVIILGAGIGTLASTINPFAVGAAIGSVKDFKVDGGQFSMGYMMTTRWLIWIVLTAIAITFVMRIAKKVQNGTYDLTGIDESKMKAKFASGSDNLEYTGKRKLSVFLFMAGFVLMILAYLPWSDWVGGAKLEKFTAMFDEKFFFIARSSMWDGGWGNWWLVPIAGIFFLVSLLVFWINKKDFEEKGSTRETVFTNTFVAGAKDVIGVCLIIAVAAGLGVILAQSNIGVWIANSSKGIGASGLVGFTLVIFALSLVLSFFVPSTSGFAAAFIPIFTTIALKAFTGAQQTAAIGLIILAFIMASGILNLVTPTSAVIMGYTKYAEVPYDFYIKKVGKFVLGITVLCAIILAIVAMLASKGTVL